MSLSECQQKINAVEFREWIVAWKMGLFFCPREDVRHAELMCMIARAAGSNSAKVEDYMADYGNKKVHQAQNPIAMRGVFDALKKIAVRGK